MSKESSYQELKARLAKVSRERDQMAMMLKATRLIPLSTSFDQSARSIYGICKSLIGATCGYVALLSEDGRENEVLFLDDGGLPCSVDPNLPMPIQGLRSVAYGSGEAVYENNFMKSEWLDLMPPGHVRLDNVMFSPLNMEKKTIGVIGLANKPADFTDEDKRMAESFADIAILALKHGHLSDKLREKEKFYREIIENISDSVLITDSGGDFTYICPNTHLIFGLIPEEIQSFKNIMNLLGNQIVNYDELDKKQEICNIPVEISDKNHQTRFLLANVKKVSIGTGTILYTFRDITEKRIADKKLEESERKFRTIVDVLPQFVAYTDNDLRYRFINKTYEKKFGVKAEEILNKTLVEVIGAEAFEKARPHVEKVLSGRKVNYHERFSYDKGEFVDIDGTLIPDMEEDGKVRGYYAILSDISQYIESQEKLQASEERQKQIIENSNAGYFFIDTEGCFQDVNTAWLNLHKYNSKKEIIGKPFSITQSDENLEEAKTIFQKAMAGHDVSVSDFSRKCKDGSVEYQIVAARHVKRNNSVVGIEGFLIDTTEKKRTEKALQESQIIFRKAFDSAPILITMSRVEDGTYMEVNDTFLKSTGFKREEVIGKQSTEIGFISVKDRKRLKAILESEGHIRDLELDLTRADGSAMTCLYSGKMIDLKGTKRLLSVAVDVTERKQQQRIILKKQSELEEHTLKLEQMNTALNVLIDHRDDKKKKRETAIIESFKKLIFPYFDISVKDKSKTEIGLIFDILKRNITEILFEGNESAMAIYSNLTPLEIQVANLIRENKSTKEIATILHTSVRAIYFHRENIRKKLNLTKNKTNLKAFLQTCN